MIVLGRELFERDESVGAGGDFWLCCEVLISLTVFYISQNEEHVLEDLLPGK